MQCLFPLFTIGTRAWSFLLSSQTFFLKVAMVILSIKIFNKTYNGWQTAFWQGCYLVSSHLIHRLVLAPMIGYHCLNSFRGNLCRKDPLLVLGHQALSALLFLVHHTKLHPFGHFALSCVNVRSSDKRLEILSLNNRCPSWLPAQVCLL